MTDATAIPPAEDRRCECFNRSCQHNSGESTPRNRCRHFGQRLRNTKDGVELTLCRACRQASPADEWEPVTPPALGNAGPVTPQTAGPGDVLVNVYTGRLYTLGRFAHDGRVYARPLRCRRPLQPGTPPGNLMPADAFGIAIHPDAEDQEVKP